MEGTLYIIKTFMPYNTPAVYFTINNILLLNNYFVINSHLD